MYNNHYHRVTTQLQLINIIMIEQYSLIGYPFLSTLLDYITIYNYF